LWSIPARSASPCGSPHPGHPDCGHRGHQLRSDEIDYVIPGNDDAIRAVKLIAGKWPTRCEGRQGEQADQEAPRRGVNRTLYFMSGGVPMDFTPKDVWSFAAAPARA
jgi:hypothetical protein